MSLEVKHLSVDVPNTNKDVKGEYIRLLDNISFKIEKGNFVALIGESGCGKSTLFKHVHGFCENNDRIRGDILFNSKERNYTEWTNKVLYIEQSYFDIIDESKTGYEFLYESSMYFGLLESEAVERIARASAILKLDQFINTTISSLSGGQKKRVYIAIAIIKEFDILLIDEPTTGLDSNTAYTVIDQLKNFMTDDKIIICAIHQPDDKILEKFDSLLLMNGGKILCNDSLPNTVKYLSSVGFERKKKFSLSHFISNSIIQNNLQKNILIKNLTKPPNQKQKKIGIFCKKNISLNKVSMIFYYELKKILSFNRTSKVYLTIFFIALSLCLAWNSKNTIFYQRNFFTVFEKYSLYCPITNINVHLVLVFSIMAHINMNVNSNYHIRHNLYTAYELFIGQLFANLVFIYPIFLLKHFFVLFYYDVTDYEKKISSMITVINMIFTIPLLYTTMLMLCYLCSNKYCSKIINYVALPMFMFPGIEGFTATILSLSNDLIVRVFFSYLLLIFPNSYMIFVFRNFYSSISKNYVLQSENLAMDIFHSSQNLANMSNIYLNNIETGIYTVFCAGILIIILNLAIKYQFGLRYSY